MCYSDKLRECVLRKGETETEQDWRAKWSDAGGSQTNTSLLWHYWWAAHPKYKLETHINRDGPPDPENFLSNPCMQTHHVHGHNLWAQWTLLWGSRKKIHTRAAALHIDVTHYWEQYAWRDTQNEKRMLRKLRNSHACRFWELSCNVMK